MEAFAKLLGLLESFAQESSAREVRVTVSPAPIDAGNPDYRVGSGDGCSRMQGDPAERRVYINAGQYFEPVPEEAWSYQIGGYQVCEKWLKDRVERVITLEEILTYSKVVTALGKTISI